MPNLERFIEDMQKRIPELDFEGKRLALDMLGITVWLDDRNVEVTGTIDPESVIVRTPYSKTFPLFKQKCQGFPVMPRLERGIKGGEVSMVTKCKQYREKTPFTRGVFS